MVRRHAVHGALGLQVENRPGVTAGRRRLVKRPMYNRFRNAGVRRLEWIAVQALDLVHGQFAVKHQNLVHVPVEGGPHDPFTKSPRTSGCETRSEFVPAGAEAFNTLFT